MHSLKRLTFRYFENYITRKWIIITLKEINCASIRIYK
jgi:hypothetical protein